MSCCCAVDSAWACGVIKKGPISNVILASRFSQHAPEKDVRYRGGCHHPCRGDAACAELFFEVNVRLVFEREARGGVEAEPDGCRASDDRAGGRAFLEKQNQQKTCQHGQGEGDVDDRHVVQGKAVVMKRLKDLGAVGGEAVDGDVGDPGDKDKPGRLPLGHASFPVNFCQQPAKDKGGHKAHQDRMGNAAVP